MNILKDLFIGIMFVATSAQSTTSYPLPLVVSGQNTPVAIMIVQSVDDTTVSNDEKVKSDTQSDVKEEIDFLSIEVLNTSLPISLRRQYVQAYFEEHPELALIAYCESTLKHNNDDGSVLRGRVDSQDIGIMQINERYHGATAEELGYDIYTLRGNLAYARYLYEKQGSKPWKASQFCWGA